MSKMRATMGPATCPQSWSEAMSQAHLWLQWTANRKAVFSCSRSCSTLAAAAATPGAKAVSGPKTEDTQATIQARARL